MDIKKLPIIGPVIDAVDRDVNSSEHNFKKDLVSTLKEQGVIDDQTGKMIQDYLDTGDDQGMGDRLRALIALGVIPKEAVPLINKIADKDGVPKTSLNRQAMYQPMSETEALQKVGPERVRAFGKGNLLDQPTQWSPAGGYANLGMVY